MHFYFAALPKLIAMKLSTIWLFMINDYYLSSICSSKPKLLTSQGDRRSEEFIVPSLLVKIFLNV